MTKMGEKGFKGACPGVVRGERAVTVRKEGADLGLTVGLVNADLKTENVGCERDLHR